MSESTPLSTVELCQWQDGTLASAKNILVADKHLHPMLFVLAFDKLIDPELARNLSAVRLKKNLRELTQGAIVELRHPLIGIPDAAMIGAVMRALPAHEQKTIQGLLSNVVTRCGDGRPDALVDLLAFAEGLDGDAVLKSLLKAIMHVKRIDESELLAIYIKDFLSRTRALAYLHVHESWLNTAGARIPGKSLSELPDSRECIAIRMEAGRFSRFLSLPFTRTQRDVGDVTGFGELIEVRSDMKDTECVGTFSNLLQSDADVLREAEGK